MFKELFKRLSRDEEITHLETELEAEQVKNEILHGEIKLLYERLIEEVKSKVIIPSDDRVEVGVEINPEHVNKTRIPWAVKQRQLEMADRLEFKRKAKEAAEGISAEKLVKANTTDELEDALGVK